MRTFLPLALAALLAPALAGCFAPDAPETPAAVEEPAPQARAAATSAEGAPEPQTGRLVVLARMPDLSPLAGVNVTVRNESRLTDAEGFARFDALAPGLAEVEARKEAHRTAQLAVQIVAGQEARTEAVLAPSEGGQHAHEKGLFAHRDLYAFEGRFDCSATYLIITGDCMLAFDTAANQTGLPARPGDQTAERHLIDFPLDLTWTALVVEMTWSATAPTPATGEGMTLALEPAEAPADGHAAKYARAVGGAPLRLELLAGQKHETATAEDMPNPLGGEVIRARAYVQGIAHNPGGTDFLGVGAAKDQTFTLYVSVFYGEPAPEGYTAIPGGA